MLRIGIVPPISRSGKEIAFHAANWPPDRSLRPDGTHFRGSDGASVASGRSTGVGRGVLHDNDRDHSRRGSYRASLSWPGSCLPTGFRRHRLPLSALDRMVLFSGNTRPTGPLANTPTDLDGFTRDSRRHDNSANEFAFLPSSGESEFGRGIQTAINSSVGAIGQGVRARAPETIRD
jgi:hypothetical protein